MKSIFVVLDESTACCCSGFLLKAAVSLASPEKITLCPALSVFNSKAPTNIYRLVVKSKLTSPKL